MMMGSMGGARKRIVLAALAVLLALAPVAVHATIFDDGNDRKFVNELRAKDPATLTGEEKAILVAANKVGVIGVCGGSHGGNAFLIRFMGRDAVVTSAHIMVEDGGAEKCKTELGAFYMPNTPHFDTRAPDLDKEFRLRRVPLQFPPINFGNIRAGIKYKDDFAVFYLDEDISGDVMPDGTLRGYLRFARQLDGGDNLYMIGFAKDFNKSLDAIYQERCFHQVRGAGNFYHGCDTLKSSSGSLLATYEDGELRFRALHTSSVASQLHREAEAIRIVPNIGTSFEAVQSAMDAYAENPPPAFLASDLQWRLRRAGCYSGKLDNQWGPSSRKALAAFAMAAATELPGTEPSPELLAAVEKAAPEGTEVCRR